MVDNYDKLGTTESATTSEKVATTQKHSQIPFVTVETYDENEDTTAVEAAILLRKSCTYQYLLVPILSLLTLLVFPLVLYWKVTMQRDYLYKRATSVDTATHIYIEGRGKRAYL